MPLTPQQPATLAAASIETFTREIATQPEGQCQIEWTDPDGTGMRAEVFRWQRIDGFSRGDIIDITAQGRSERTLAIPATSRTERVEITLNPDDHMVVTVGDDGWEYGAIIRGARPYLDPASMQRDADV